MAGPAVFELTSSRQFPDWLGEQKLSLALTTYQAGKLFLLGLQPDGRLSVFERTFNRCLGLHATDQTLWLSSLYQLWRFENVLEAGQTAESFDRLYVPQVGYVTGDLDIHDVAVEATGRVVFVNTLFGCLATISDTHSFVPLWKPPFIDRLAAEDRCHLNGLALENGRAKYVTAVSQSNVADGWRDRRHDGGCVIDVQTNDIVAVGDGANDLGMLQLAGSGVALHAKPIVAEQAKFRIDHGDLTALLYIQGYRKADFAT